MKKIDGSITTEDDLKSTEEFLMAYSEEERQENEINKHNSKAVFSPEFIPYRVDIKKAFKLSHLETILYGFIRFYKANNSNKFYFVNDQLASMLDCSVSSIEKAMANLSKKGVIGVSYKVKAGGGRIRFINSLTVKNCSSDLQKITVLNRKKLMGNKNKINKNKINNHFNKIFGDEDFKRWVLLKKDKSNYQKVIALEKKLNDRYPKYRYSEEWNEAVALSKTL